jgi:hypothetical protein
MLDRALIVMRRCSAFILLSFILLLLYMMEYISTLHFNHGVDC